jgi:hypothetical protein
VVEDEGRRLRNRRGDVEAGMFCRRFGVGMQNITMPKLECVEDEMFRLGCRRLGARIGM